MNSGIVYFFGLCMTCEQVGTFCIACDFFVLYFVIISRHMYTVNLIIYLKVALVNQTRFLPGEALL